MSKSELAEVLDKVRHGDYTNALKEVGGIKRFCEVSHYELATDALALNATALTAEIYDHSGRYKQARDVLVHAGEVLASAEQMDGSSNLTARARDDYARLCQSQCRYLIQGGVSAYRENRYERALTFFRVAEKLLPNVPISVHEPGKNSCGPWIQLQYWKGHILRHVRDYSAANECYQAVLDAILNWLSTEAREEGMRSQFALYQIGSCLGMGLGWLHYRAGNLSFAKSNLLAAKALLSVAGSDILRKAYVDLLLGSVYRALSGGTKIGHEALQKRAVALMEAARDKFDEHGHVLYRGRAHCGLAIFCALSDESEILREGLKHASRAISDSSNAEDWECWCQAYVARSRIHRKLREFEAATADASLAERTASERHQGLSRVEALIASGEATFHQAEDRDQSELYLRALELFQEAYRLTEQNTRQAAVCHLHITRTSLRRGEREVARSHFEEFKKLRPMVQNGFIATLGKQVEEELYPSRDVLILDVKTATTEKGIYPKLEAELRRFLVQRAQQSHNREKAIEQLGISRQTFYAWKKSIGD